MKNVEFMVCLKAAMCLKQNQPPKSPSLNTRFNILNGVYLHKRHTSGYDILLKLNVLSLVRFRKRSCYEL